MAYEAPTLSGFMGTLTDDPNEEDRAEAVEQTEEDRYASGEWEEGGGQLHANEEDSAERRRRDYGLEGDEIYDYAERLYGIGERDVKTEGQVEAEKELAILSKAQRGRAMGYGGFNAAELLQKAGRSAQQAELGGEAAIDTAARQAAMAARDQLEQLLISGKQRAENKAFAMQQLEFQQGQASGSLWSNVLGGVLGAIGAVVGGVVTMSPAGAIAGATAGSALGSGGGRYLG